MAPQCTKNPHYGPAEFVKRNGRATSGAAAGIRRAPKPSFASLQHTRRWYPPGIHPGGSQLFDTDSVRLGVPKPAYLKASGRTRRIPNISQQLTDVLPTSNKRGHPCRTSWTTPNCRPAARSAGGDRFREQAIGRRLPPQGITKPGVRLSYPCKIYGSNSPRQGVEIMEASLVRW